VGITTYNLDSASLFSAKLRNTGLFFLFSVFHFIEARKIRRETEADGAIYLKYIQIRAYSSVG
jgi:hypothetical protein